MSDSILLYNEPDAPRQPPEVEVYQGDLFITRDDEDCGKVLIMVTDEDTIVILTGVDIGGVYDLSDYKGELIQENKVSKIHVSVISMSI